MAQAQVVNKGAPVKQAQPTNFMYDLMKAVMHDQSTMSQQQLTDAQSTMNATKFETAIYNYWKGRLAYYAGQVQSAATSGNSKTRSARTQAAQAAYSNANADAQMNESQGNAIIQTTQGQTQSDATNLQMKAQIQQSANSILTTLVNMLGTITA